jgi:hypothetical protein
MARRQILQAPPVRGVVGTADKQRTPTKKLILATAAPNDAPLMKKGQELSDAREAKGPLPVEVLHGRQRLVV